MYNNSIGKGCWWQPQKPVWIWYVFPIQVGVLTLSWDSHGTLTWKSPDEDSTKVPWKELTSCFCILCGVKLILLQDCTIVNYVQADDTKLLGLGYTVLHACKE